MFGFFTKVYVGRMGVFMELENKVLVKLFFSLHLGKVPVILSPPPPPPPQCDFVYWTLFSTFNFLSFCNIWLVTMNTCFISVVAVKDHCVTLDVAFLKSYHCDESVYLLGVCRHEDTKHGHQPYGNPLTPTPPPHTYTHIHFCISMRETGTYKLA